MDSVTNNFILDTDLILDSSTDWTEKKNLHSALTVPEINSKSLDTGSTV